MSYVFTEDWFSHNAPNWTKWLSGIAGRPGARGLEIGSFQGRSAVWLLENVLTHPTSRLTCVDTFEGSVENTPGQKADLFNIFERNLSPFSSRVDVFRGYSQAFLRTLPREETYDVVYIDGDHAATSVLEDAALAFPLLKVGGVVIFDDYEWALMPKPTDRPRIAIDAFLSVYADHVRVLAVEYQVAVQKTRSLY